MKLCGFHSVCTKSISNINMNCPFNHHEHLSIYVKCDKKKEKKKRKTFTLDKIHNKTF